MYHKELFLNYMSLEKRSRTDKLISSPNADQSGLLLFQNSNLKKNINQVLVQTFTP